jgi:DNA modification methylase
LAGRAPWPSIAQRTGRHFIHVDVSKKYCQIAAERVANEMKQMRLDEIETHKSELVIAATSITEVKPKHPTPRKARKK